MNYDMKTLAPQLRNPEGAMGKDVATMMVQYNGQAIAFTIECLDIRPTDAVLEIGFGPGEGLAEAARLASKGFVAGIDHSQLMIDMATERNHRAIMQEQIELMLGEAASMPYRDEMFHKVFAVNVAHFWNDPSVELAEIYRVLKPGGCVGLFFSDPKDWPAGMVESGVFHPRVPTAWEDFLTTAGFHEVHMATKQLSKGIGYCVLGSK